MKVINLDNCINVRDICYKNISPNKLIRGSALNKLSQNDIEKLYNKYNVKTIIDLRTPSELEDEKDILQPNVKYHNIPLINEETLGITHGNTTKEKLLNLKNNMPNMCILYERLVARDKEKQWKEIFNILLNNNDGAILWHCKQGKDRCGIVSALIEYVLGIDYETIMKDYLYTNNYCYQKADKMYQLMLEINDKNELADEIKDLFIAKEQYLESAFNYINNEYGNMNNFLYNICGLDDNKIHILRAKYTKKEDLS